MILVDSSAWIEFLRDTGSDTCNEVDVLLDDDVATCDPVRMEILAGALDEGHLADLRGLLARATTLPTSSQHFEHAARLYRQCRRSGETVRKLVNCLIGAVAIEADVPILHRDVDYDVLSRHTALRITTPRDA